HPLSCNVLIIGKPHCPVDLFPKEKAPSSNYTDEIK
ncbi:MAG: hypothetical protein ACI9LF_002072, partial [Flavobacteriales bacterium]